MQMLGKMNDLGNHMVNGLMSNETLSTESIVIFVNQHNKTALANINEQKPMEDVDIRPGMDLEDTETRMSKLEKKYKIQEGAAQGKSICKKHLPSQNKSREKGRKERSIWVLLSDILSTSFPKMFEIGQNHNQMRFSRR